MKNTKSDKLDIIREQAIDLVAAAMQDDELPAVKRADMALSLLGKAAIKQQDEPQDGEPWEMWFLEEDSEGNVTRKFGYAFVRQGTFDRETGQEYAR